MFREDANTFFDLLLKQSGKEIPEDNRLQQREQNPSKEVCKCFPAICQNILQAQLTSQKDKAIMIYIVKITAATTTKCIH